MNQATEKAATQAMQYRAQASRMAELRHDAARVMNAAREANASPEAMEAAAVAHALAMQAENAARVAADAAASLVGELFKGDRKP